MNIASAISSLKTTNEDTNKVRLLKKTAWDISYESSYIKIEYIKQTCVLAIKLNYSYGIAISASTLGSIYTDMGKYKNALTCFYEAMGLEKKYGYKLDLDSAYSNIGILFGKKAKLLRLLIFIATHLITIKF